MNRDIVKYPNPLLKKRSEEVKEISEDVKNLIKDMEEAMVKNNGIGLAAPQVGESKRIIIIQDGQEIKVFVNPVIIKKSRDKEIMEEGCLSLPNVYFKIKRSKEIEVESLNEKRERLKIRAKGKPARIIQHEVDHLDGILFINRLGFWQKLKNRKKLNGLN